MTQVQDEPSDDAEEVEIPTEVLEAPVEKILMETELATQRNVPVEGMPIDVSENIKLESYVNKTIVNDNNVEDVPEYQEKDKMLEEVRKMISEPPAELTTVVETATYHYVPQTTTESTTVHVEELTTASTVPVTTTLTLEAETIFVPIDSRNNENINNYEEKLTIITTAESTTPVSDLVGLVNGIESRSFTYDLIDFNGN